MFSKMEDKIKLKPTKYDIILYAIVLLVIISVMILTLSFRTSKDNLVTVKYANNVVKTMKLAEDQEFVMQTSDYPLLLGDLTIEISNSRVRIKEETSNYHYCSLQSWVDSKGTSLICAPNHVVVSIEGYVDSGIDYPAGGGQ